MVLFIFKFSLRVFFGVRYFFLTGTVLRRKEVDESHRYLREERELMSTKLVFPSLPRRAASVFLVGQTSEGGDSL